MLKGRGGSGGKGPDREGLGSYIKESDFNLSEKRNHQRVSGRLAFQNIILFI